MAVFSSTQKTATCCGAFRWANNLGGLCFEIRMVAGHVPLQPVRLHSRLLPDAVRQVLADSKRLSQFAATPMGRSAGRRFACRVQNLGRQAGRQPIWLPVWVTRIQCIYACHQEAFSPPMMVGVVVPIRSRIAASVTSSASIRISLPGTHTQPVASATARCWSVHSSVIRST